jgi:peptide deformylase
MLKKGDPISPIIQDGDPVLRAIAHPVPKADFGTKKLNDILEEMTIALAREHDGVAIAAPQIGISLRIFIVARGAFVIEEKPEKEGKEKSETPAPPKKTMPKKNMIAINPEIIKLSRKKVKVPEGCLSVRWLYGNMIRSEKAILRAYDENGKLFTYGGSGLITQIFQHETDHLNGILFIDHATEIEELSPEEIAKIQAKAKKNSSS